MSEQASEAAIVSAIKLEQNPKNKLRLYIEYLQSTTVGEKDGTLSRVISANLDEKEAKLFEAYVDLLHRFHDHMSMEGAVDLLEEIENIDIQSRDVQEPLFDEWIRNGITSLQLNLDVGKKRVEKAKKQAEEKGGEINEADYFKSSAECALSHLTKLRIEEFFGG